MKRTKFKFTVDENAEKQAKQNRAIKGEIKPGKEGDALYAIVNDLKKLWWDDPRVDKIDLWEPIHGGDYAEAERYIIEDVQNWLDTTKDDRKFCRLLELDEKTKRWLRDRIPDWSEYIERAKQISPLSNTLKGQINYRFTELLWECIKGYPLFRNDYFPDFEVEGEPFDAQALWSVFFNKQEPWNDEDSRFRKIQNRALDELRKELSFLGEYLDTLGTKQRREFPYQWIKGDTQIDRNLKRGNRHCLDLYALLMEGRMKPKKEFQENAPVMIVVNYDQIKKEFGLTPTQARRYLQEMERWGIVKKIASHGGKTDKHATSYSIGYWAKGKGKFPRPVFFLKNTPEMKQALREFDVNRRLK